MVIGILGKNSYIGSSLQNFLSSNSKHEVTEIDTMTDEWKTISFSNFDSILCVTGIAHVSSDASKANLYYSVNRDLPFSMALKAKKEGVKQYIFMSSIIIYGDDPIIGQEKCIDQNTIPNPSNYYGESKYQAEKKLLALSDETFKIFIIRTPMVYGPGCKGNFPKLVKIAKILPIFPLIENKRSYIFIYNLCKYFENIIEQGLQGIGYPQDKEYISTVEIVRASSNLYGKKIYMIKFFNPLIFLLSKQFSIINKVFGSKYYDKLLTKDINAYNIYNKEEALKTTIKSL